MRMRWLPLLLIAALVGVGCGPAAEEPAEPEAPAETAMSDEDMLAALTERFEEAWNRGDAAALAAMFAEDGDSVGPEGERFHGRDAVEQRYADLLGGTFEGTTVTIDQTSVKFLADDVAIANGTYEISGMTSSEGEELPPVKGLYTNLSVKENGEWLIHSSRPMVPVENPGT